MDRGDHHQHQFLMPPPVMPMMDEKFLGGGGGGGATPGRGAAGERRRRFTEEQIRSLESMFHAHHAKLEPREKAELARELGLQPRQVAIWFQNKRARWRTKQLEHDYAVLRAKYDDLHARVESLKQEKPALIAELHKLSERLREWEERGGNGGSATATATASSSCCNDGGEELYDDKRYVAGCVNINPPESCMLGGTTCATPTDISVESECDDHLDYDGGFPQSFCATSELWEPWPLVEWNAVA